MHETKARQWSALKKLETAVIDYPTRTQKTSTTENPGTEHRGARHPHGHDDGASHVQSSHTDPVELFGLHFYA